MWLVGCLAAAAAAAAAAKRPRPEVSTTLRDHPVVGTEIQYLDGHDWKASSPPNDGLTDKPLTIAATVPGDIVSDLYAAGMIGNPLFELNWLNASLWDKGRHAAARDWTFTKEFDVYPAEQGQDQEMLLVLDGVKMGATVFLNGVVLGTCTDQFLRYTFPIQEHLRREGKQVLSIEFARSSPMNCDGRWMGCSGGWDWAPYTNTMQEGAHTFTYGVWKSVSVVTVKAAAITNMVPHTYYQGAYTTEPLDDKTHGGFVVKVRVHWWAPYAGNGVLTVHGAWQASGVNTTTAISWPAGDNNATLTLSATVADGIELWWPAGSGFDSPYGARPTRYAVNATLTPATTLPAGGAGAASAAGAAAGAAGAGAAGAAAAAAVGVDGPLVASRMIGFRDIALVTINDTDADAVKQAAGEEGSGTHGMMFRVNGAATFVRGASMIPMEEMEGWYNADAHFELVVAAAEGRFNMLRAWGGGIWYPQVWYDTCDALGIMIYHDMQYAQGGHAPAVTATQEAELRYQTRRLSHHPSIVVWDGCNECAVIMNTSTEIYASFVLKTVAEEDTSRPIWPSCPSHGWTAGVEKLTSLPIAGARLTTPNPADPGIKLLETHRPKWRASGFPSVNGKTELNPQPSKFMCVPSLGPCNWQGLFQSNIPLNLTQQAVGPDQPNVFSSESPGASVMSSFESMSPTLAKEHWGIHGGAAWDTCDGKVAGDTHCTEGNNVMAQRNYPCDNYIAVYFGMGALASLNQTGEQAFKRQLFQCMIAQALIVKQNVELTRATPRFGILVWQLNEIWPTGGWGSIEYGNPAFEGQVIGGRWKPLQYWYRASLYGDVFATCDGNKGLCYVKNDAPRPFVGTLVINATSLATAETTTIATQSVSLPAGAGAIAWFTFPAVAALEDTTNVLEAIVLKGSDVAVKNFVALATPGDMKLEPANVAVTPLKSDDGTFYANVTCDAAAVYVTLTTLAHGRFEDNAFFMTPPGRVVHFKASTLSPDASPDAAWNAFSSSLRVEDASRYMQ